MSMKDNFSQAVKELLKKDNLVGENLEREAQSASELDRYLDTEQAAHPNADARPLETPYYPNSAGSVGSASSAQSNEQAPGAQPYTPPYAMPAQPYGAASLERDTEVTVISRNTVIDGNIRSFADMNVQGNIKGNVETTKNIEMSGKVVGDVSCNNILMRGSSMQGAVNSKGQVAMDKDTLLLGDVSAQYCDINGKIKGNLQVGGRAELRGEAVIFGDISASAITVLDGAIIQGYINTTYLKEDTAKIFPDTIAVGE